MRTKKLGCTDIYLSVIGLGSWAIGGGGYIFGWGSQDDNDSMNTIHKALDLGINWIDTAPLYGDGHSEMILGKAIKGKRDKVIISTKCGLHVDDKKRNWAPNLKRENLKKELERSLKLLNTDYLDLYQIHAPWPEEDIEEAWSTLLEFKKEGKIRYAGVSNFSITELKRILPIHPIDFTQPEYSMLEMSIETEYMNFHVNNNIGIICYSPMYRGMLTGKITKERIASFPNDDNRLTLDYYKEPYLSPNLSFVESLRPIANRNNKTIGELAIAWVLRREEITAAIVGARKPSQIEETVSAGDWILSQVDQIEIELLLKKHYRTLSEIQTAQTLS